MSWHGSQEVGRETEGDGVTHSVEQHEVPVVREVVPGQEVGLGAQGQHGLHRQVHDHHTLGAQLVGQDLEGIGDEQARETDVVEDTEELERGKKLAG